MRWTSTCWFRRTMRSRSYTVDQLNTKIENSKMQTGKRLGYKFCSDDI